MKVITIANQKGGVGKTTTTINLADALKHLGKNVLVIDMDPQCNTSSVLDAKTEDTYTMYDVMYGECSLADAIQNQSFLDIVPCDNNLKKTQEKTFFTQKLGGERILYKALKKLEIEADYDYVIIDTPPDLGIYLINAMMASDGVIIPMLADKFSISGLNQFVESLNEVLENGNEDLQVYGTLLVAYDNRRNFDKKIAKQLIEESKIRCIPHFKKKIRVCQKLKEACNEQKSIYDYGSKGTGARLDYRDVAWEIIQMEGEQ